jgi:AcrR family transcriptional regulator
MEDIAREVGVTKPAIYHYFASKELLFMGLVEDVRRLQEERVAELRARRLPLSQLVEAAIREGIRMLTEHPDMIRMMMRVSSFPEEVAGLHDVASLDREMHQREVEMMRDAPQDVRLRPGLSLEDFVEFYHGVFFSSISRWMFFGEPIDEVEAPKRLRDLILFGACEKAG